MSSPKIDLIRDIEDRRMVEKSTSFEAQLVITIAKLEAHVRNGLLPVAVLVEAFNEDKLDHGKLSDRYLGKVLTSMGFNKRRGGPRGETCLVWDEDVLGQLAGRFGLNEVIQRIRQEGASSDSDPQAMEKYYLNEG